MSERRGESGIVARRSGGLSPQSQTNAMGLSSTFSCLSGFNQDSKTVVIVVRIVVRIVVSVVRIVTVAVRIAIGIFSVARWILIGIWYIFVRSLVRLVSSASPLAGLRAELQPGFSSASQSASQK